MNNGNEFIESVCNRLRAKGTMVHDSDIVSEISRMRWDEIKEMCAAGQPNNVVERTLPHKFRALYIVFGRACGACAHRREISQWSTEPCVSCQVTFSNFVPMANTTER